MVVEIALHVQALRLPGRIMNSTFIQRHQLHQIPIVLVLLFCLFWILLFVLYAFIIIVISHA